MLHVLAVTNLYPTPYAPTAGTFIEQQVEGLRQIGLHIDVMVLDRIQQGRIAYLRLGQTIRSRVSELQPDIVHVMYGGIMADEVTRSVSDRPVFVSFCGTDLLGQPLVGCVRKLSAKYNVWASHRAARRATGIVVKSQNLFDALPPDINRSKVRIIPNGVDLERFKPMEKHEARQILGWPAASKVVLFVSVRGHPRKRLDLAQESVAKVKACSGEVTLRVMQGVPHDRVPIWMNASDVLILTSVHEGSVNAVKEAMACNLPIVSVDVGDVRERLHGVRLCTIADPDSDALANALANVLRQSDRSDGRNHLAGLTTLAIADQLNSFYGQTVGQVS